MAYCHVSAQIVQHSYDEDEIRCTECDSENVEVERNRRYWYKKCLDCGLKEDNEDF